VILHSHIDSTEILIINVDDNTSYTHGIIDIPLLNATNVSDFKKTLCNNLRWHSKITKLAMLESTETINYMINITFEDLHQNALPGILVPQMFDLFDNVRYL
jgi:hypothetical protein